MTGAGVSLTVDAVVDVEVLDSGVDADVDALDSGVDVGAGVEDVLGDAPEAASSRSSEHAPAMREVQAIPAAVIRILRRAESP